MVLRRLALDPTVRIAVAVWIAANGFALLLAGGRLPFDRPALAGIPFAVQMAAPTIGMVQILLLLALIYWLTRNRVAPDVAGRAPDRPTAARETFALLAYAAAGQAGGWIVGPALGYRPFSFHIAGTVYGCSTIPAPGEFATWAIYNFVVFAVVPYLWFRRRYDATQLCLRSVDRRNDLLVIVVVCLFDGAFELATLGTGFFHLNPRQIMLGAPLAFILFFIGTVLPTMVLIYSILLPRYLKLTGSATATVFLGGLTYAVMHLVEGWSAFDSPRDGVVADLRVSGLHRPGDGQVPDHASHGERVGPHDRLPCRRAARDRRHAARRARLRHLNRVRTLSLAGEYLSDRARRARRYCDR